MKKLALLLLTVVLVPCASRRIPRRRRRKEWPISTPISPRWSRSSTRSPPPAGQSVYTRISTTKYLRTVLTEFQAGKLRPTMLQGPLPILQALKEKGCSRRTGLPPPRLPRLGDSGRHHRPVRHRICRPDLQQELVKQETSLKSTRNLRTRNGATRSSCRTPPPTHHHLLLVGLKEAGVFRERQGVEDFLRARGQQSDVRQFLQPTPAPVESGEKLIAISMPKYIITHPKAPLDWARTGLLLGTPRAWRSRPRRPTPTPPGSSWITGFRGTP